MRRLSGVGLGGSAEQEELFGAGCGEAGGGGEGSVVEVLDEQAVVEALDEQAAVESGPAQGVVGDRGRFSV